MQFDLTQTYHNLAKSFAGETQAGMRYQLIARMATQQGYAQLAEVLKSIAKNETVHARRFFEELNKRGTKLDSVAIQADYPFHGGTMEECLAFAKMDERKEHSEIYPTFAEIARQEGFEDIAQLYTQIANVEKHHEAVFEYLHQAMKNGTLYANESPMVYICSECGHMHTATKAWDICPLCKSSQGYCIVHLPYQKEQI